MTLPACRKAKGKQDVQQERQGVISKCTCQSYTSQAALLTSVMNAHRIASPTGRHAAGTQASKAQLPCLLERDDKGVLQTALVHNLPPDELLECLHLSNCHTAVSH